MAALYDLLAPGQPSRMGMIEGDPEYDPWSMQAARTRARYPTRMPDPASLAASRGAVGFSDLPGFDEARRQAGNVYAGEDYNPSSLVQMAMGAVGAPGMVGGVPGLGSGVGRVPTFSPEGLAKQGPAYSKAMQEVLAEIAAGPKGAGPMNLSGTRMEVPQAALERYEPPRGVSPRLTEAMANPAVSKGIEQSMQRGQELGAHEWYNTAPVREAFINELGPVEGQQAFSRYMDMVAATSPRSDVPTNVRNASYFYVLDAQGRPLPASNPYPYGHIAQKLHRQNIETLANAPRELSAGTPQTPGPSTAWDIFANPKPASFSHNLQGNLTPVTVDTHAFRNIAMRTGDPRFLETSITQMYKPGKDPSLDSLVQRYGEVKGDKVIFRPQKLYNEGRLDIADAPPSFWASKPNPNEYGAAERFYTDIGARQGLLPAQGQAAAWSGAGELTGLGSSPSHTFPQLMNERVLFTAKMRGENPNDTLRDFIRGKKPLLGLAGAAAAAPSLLDLHQPQQ